MISRPARLVVQGLALAGVVAGSVAFAGFDKSIDLVVDGRTQSVHAFGDTVDDVLRSEGITVGEHDIVSPARSEKIEDGHDVVVRYGRQLSVTLDGAKQSYWTTALSVDEALKQLGLRADSAQLSVSRSLPLGRHGLTMAMDTRKTVDLTVGAGHAAERTTYATTVGELLDELDVTVGRLDKLSVPATAPLSDATRVTVTRITQKRTTKNVLVAYDVRSTKTKSMDKGETKVVTEGKAGTKKVTYLDTFTNGKRTKHAVVTTVVVKKPVTQKQKVGTRAPSVSLPSGGGGLNWAALAKCESGGNPRAVNPAGYYGLYQFSLSTWHRVGGSGNPIDASPSEQLKRAKILYARSGAGQWGCGSHLND